MHGDNYISAAEWLFYLPWKPNILLIKKFHHFLLYAWFMSWELETVMQVRKVILRAMLWINWDFIALFQEWQRNWENYGPWDRNYCSKRNKITYRAHSWLSSCFPEKCKNVWLLQRLENLMCRVLHVKFLWNFAAWRPNFGTVWKKKKKLSFYIISDKINNIQII